MPATVKGGMFEANGVAVLSTIHTTSALRKVAAKALGRDQMYGLRAIMYALTGNVVGGIASKSLTRVAATEELGGVRPIEVETIINRATVGNDITEIREDILSLSSKTYNPNPPANLDGNPLGTR